MVECKFCGAENEETREACWNCFAPLKGVSAEAMKERMAKITESMPAEAVATGEAVPAVKPRRRGLSLGWLVGIVLILLIGGGGFFFYTKIFREKPQQVTKDFVNAFVQGMSNQDLAVIKPYIDPVDAATLPTTKQELKEKVLSYLRSMGVNVQEKMGGMDIIDLISSLKPTIQSITAQTESASLNEAKVRVQVSLAAGGALPAMVKLPSLQGSLTLTLVRQGLDWKVSLSKSFPSSTTMPVGNVPVSK